MEDSGVGDSISNMVRTHQKHYINVNANVIYESDKQLISVLFFKTEELSNLMK